MFSYLFYSSAKLPKEIKDEKVKPPPILLFTPPPIDAKKWDKCCMEFFNDTSPRTNDAAKAYGDRVKSVARDTECLVVDAFSLLGGDHAEGDTHYGKHLEDGLHLNEFGNRLLYDVSVDQHSQRF